MATSFLFFISVFLAGILSFFSPCILPLMPVYVGILLDSGQPKTVRFMGKDISWYGLAKTLCFIAGLSTVFLVLGYGAGALGQVLYAPWFRYVLGGIVILLGIHQMGWEFTRWGSSISSSCKSKRASNLKRIVKEVIFLTLFSWVSPLALVGRPVWDLF